MVISDLHWACAEEQARAGHESRVVQNPCLRLAAYCWRRWVWLATPHGHNHRVAAILGRTGTNGADWCLANGDFTLDTAFVGVSDEAACVSAGECLSPLRAAWGSRLLTTIGDHELGKVSLFGGAGGLRRRSLERCESELGLSRFWVQPGGDGVVLIGVTSTLAAWTLFADETPVNERAWWRKQQARHLAQISDAFSDLTPGQRVVLCCHDPSALAFLYELAEVRQRLGQLACTVIGHLHSAKVWSLARNLAGFPRVPWMGVTFRRYTTALHRSRCWREFGIALCPAPAGLQLFKDGGWLEIDIPPGAAPAQVVRQRLPWNLAEPAT